MAAPAIDPAAPWLIVLNGGSGRNDAASTRALIEAELSAAGRAHELQVIDDPRQLAQAARATVARARACGGVVVAAGGDGTINTMAQATLGSGCAFAVLPQGTFNYFGRTQGIPLETAEAVRTLLGARAHPVQVGLINDRVFLVNASLGLYPQVLEDREAYKHRFGRNRLVALGAGLMSALKPHPQLRLSIEHADQRHELRTPTLFVGNNRLQLEQIGIAEAPRLDEGLLAGIALRPVGSPALLALMLRGALGRLGDADKVVSFAFERIRVQAAARRLKVAADGEVMWMRPPIDFRVAPEPLYLLRPEPSDAAP